MTRWSSLTESEDDYLDKILDTALRNQWMAVHFIPAIVASGRRITPFKGLRGFPDLVLAREGEVLIPEIKKDGQYPKPDQRRWLHHLGDLGRVWRPSDWNDVVLPTLTRRAA